MTNLQNFNNKSFQRTVKRVRQVMPYLAVSLLFVVYAVSAITEGVFLSALMENVKAGAWLSYSIAVAIQATRALLVFFPQLNPNRPTFGYQGETIAIIMGLIAIGSILGLVNAMGLQTPVAVSLSILMLAGIGVEVYFLREIRYATELELYENRAHWQNLKDYHQAKEEFRSFLDQLKDFQYQGNSQQSNSDTSPTTQSKRISRDFINKLVLGGLSNEQMTKIWKFIEAGISEDQILEFIAENNKVNAPQLDKEAYNEGKPLSETDIYDLYRKHKSGKLPYDLKFTEEQTSQIRNVAESYGIDVSKILPGSDPLDFSVNGNKKHV